MAEVVFLNDRFVSSEDARIPVLEPGFLYGWGVFETMRSINGKIVYLDAHLNRLHVSCHLLDIELAYSLDRLKSIIQDVVCMNKIQDARVRLNVWQKQGGCGVLVAAEKYKPLSKKKYSQGFHLCVAALRQSEDSFLCRIKSMNHLFYQICYNQARSKGFNEAIIINTHGYIAECSRANVFLVKDKELFTPSLECGCLGGITRMAVLDLATKNKIRCYEGEFTLPYLKSADEVFVTNSLLGIMPVTSLENSKIGKADKITRFLSGKYLQSCNSQR